VAEVAGVVLLLTPSAEPVRDGSPDPPSVEKLLPDMLTSPLPRD
jgi:hypothetical protein